MKFIYKHKVDGRRKETKEKIQDKEWILIGIYKDTAMKKTDKIITK